MLLVILCCAELGRPPRTGIAGSFTGGSGGAAGTGASPNGPSGPKPLSADSSLVLCSSTRRGVLAARTPLPALDTVLVPAEAIGAGLAGCWGSNHSISKGRSPAQS